ncbi:hypothetical protein PVAG01_11103 [Phlyctema vagabunda]|uniref:Apple domain-containing protein n=1 Tax=Phlyctema vagabunda TaxID=108571 RepID=A0ABR4P1C8_9HELO
MKLLVYFLCMVATASGKSLGERAVCNADNCARAVTGTANAKYPASLRLADCQAFLATTTTPKVSTSTVYSNVVGTTTISVTPTPVMITTTTTQSPAITARAVKEQQADGQVVPIYASACSGAARYSSACNCWGALSRITVTAEVPITIITIVSTTSILTVTETLPTLTRTTIATATATPVGTCDTEFDGFQSYLSYLPGSNLKGHRELVRSVSSRKACCQACFDVAAHPGCMVANWTRDLFGSYGCDLLISESGVDTIAQCPAGREGFTAVSSGTNPSNSILGPCGILVT